MLVDLARNDMGRISEFGTVKVTQFMDVANYSHVMHIVSQVEGRKRRVPSAGSRKIVSSGRNIKQGTKDKGYGNYR